MTLFIRRAIIIVNQGNRVAANSSAKQVDRVGGEFTFTVGLSPSGNLPATHFWANWQMLESERLTLGDLLDVIPGQAVQVFDLSSHDPKAAKPTPGEVLAASTPPLKVISARNVAVEPI